ncbi:ribonuclease H-like domain-containing protein, partial [Tanacetum coccineum]
MQFLMGLDDSYMQIRTSILSREVLPDVRSAYATISSEESYRVAADSIDLNLKNVLEIGEQCEGLYYYNDQDPVLNVLKDSLLIDKKDNTICCEICQRAKQTREPFPLSDHTFKRLGDLVHLDLWGPYKVTSSEGFRFFLTIVDDCTRAVWVYLIKSKDE